MGLGDASRWLRYGFLNFQGFRIKYLAEARDVPDRCQCTHMEEVLPAVSAPRARPNPTPEST